MTSGDRGSGSSIDQPVDQPANQNPDNQNPDDMELDEPAPSDPTLEEPVDRPGVVVPGGVDPRMRERWIGARRREGRRRLRWVMTVIVALGIVGIAYLMVSSPLLGARTVTVRGGTRVTAAMVRAADHVGHGDPLLLLDEAAIARHVERIPYVQRAQVTTDLPSTVVITVTERVGVAWARNAGPRPIAIIDGGGRVLERTTVAPADLPEVIGAGASGAAGRNVPLVAPFRALQRFPDALRSRARTLTIRSGAATLTVRGDPPEVGEVQFGRWTQVHRKAVAALAVLDALRARGERAAVLDVRVPESPATR